MYGFNITNYIDYDYNFIAKLIKRENSNCGFTITKWKEEDEYCMVFGNNEVRLPKGLNLEECIINKDNLKNKIKVCDLLDLLKLENLSSYHNKLNSITTK